MSTKVFYTFYITKTPSQTGFGCRKSVENPVENRVESRPARHLRSQFGNGGLGVLTHRPSVCCQGGPRPGCHLRSQFGNAGLGVLTHQPSVCCQGGPRPGCHLTCRACLRGPRPARHLRSQFGNTGLVVLTHQPSAAMRVLPMRSSLPAPRHLPRLPQRLTCRACVPVSAPLPRVLGQDLSPALIGPEGLTWGV